MTTAGPDPTAQTGGTAKLDVADALKLLTLEKTPTHTIIDSCDSIASLIDSIVNLPTEPPSLYVDIEGVNLSRHGSVSILQIYVLPLKHTYLIDIVGLGKKAFDTAGNNGETLKTIFESELIPKAFFDIRNDSDALHGHFGIKFAGVEDIQLMELATRAFNRRCVNGLSRCIEKDVQMNGAEKIAWMRAKDKGKALFAPERGGTYEVFNQRPLREDIIQYCVQDVQLLPILWKRYQSKMTPRWSDKVRLETQVRIRSSQSVSYNGKGRHMAMAPAGWA